MSEALDRSRVRRIALVEEKADGSDFARLEVPPATLAVAQGLGVAGITLGAIDIILNALQPLDSCETSQ